MDWSYYNLFKRLDRIDAALASLAAEQSQLRSFLMALADDLKAAIAQLNTETTAIAGVITSLASRITNSMSDADVATVKQGLADLSTKLTALGVDPTNPVPNPTPPAPPKP